MNAFTIKDLENLSGIKAHTIRIWEQRYSFLKPQRTDTNIRHYRNEELKILLNIALLNKYGFKISHIDKMTPDVMREKLLSLAHADAQQERIVNDLLHFMVDMDTTTFTKTLDQYILINGIDKTISNLVFPFLKRVGILWVTDHVKVAQEHLVSNIIRQKLIMGIENAVSSAPINRTILLFLPEDEHHEVGLLYVHYLLKTRGANVIYAGADLPAEDLEFLCRIKKPDFAYSHLTSLPARFNLEKYFGTIRTHVPPTPIVISGVIAQNYHKKLPVGIIVKRSLDEVLEQLIGA